MSLGKIFFSTNFSIDATVHILTQNCSSLSRLSLQNF